MSNLTTSNVTCNGKVPVTRRRKVKTMRAREVHREIEKRRRDRMNSSLSQLRQLIPNQVAQFWEKKKLEKLDVIEMAVEHLTRLNFSNPNLAINPSPNLGSSLGSGNENLTTTNATYETGYNDCLKGVYDYFHLVANHADANFTPGHLFSYLEHRLTLDQSMKPMTMVNSSPCPSACSSVLSYTANSASTIIARPSVIAINPEIKISNEENSSTKHKTRTISGHHQRARSSSFFKKSLKERYFKGTLSE